jgi:hypothetical protein
MWYKMTETEKDELYMRLKALRLFKTVSDNDVTYDHEAARYNAILVGMLAQTMNRSTSTIKKWAAKWKIPVT